MRKAYVLVAVIVILAALAFGSGVLRSPLSSASCTDVHYVTEQRTDGITDNTPLPRGDANTTLFGFTLSNDTCDDQSLERVTFRIDSSATSQKISALYLYQSGVMLTGVSLPYATSGPVSLGLAEKLVVPHGAKKAFELRGDVGTSTESVPLQLLLLDATITQHGTSTVEVRRAADGMQLTWTNPEPGAIFR